MEWAAYYNPDATPKCIIREGGPYRDLTDLGHLAHSPHSAQDGGRYVPRKSIVKRTRGKPLCQSRLLKISNHDCIKEVAPLKAPPRSGIHILALHSAMTKLLRQQSSVMQDRLQFPVAFDQ